MRTLLVALVMACTAGTLTLAADGERPWMIVAGDNEPTPVMENVKRLQGELSLLTGQPIEVRSADSVTKDLRSKFHLILVGQYHRNGLARTTLDSRQLSDPWKTEPQFARQQGYVVIVEPGGETEGKSILAIGWDELGAVFAVSHLRTHFQASNRQLFLDCETSPNDSAFVQEIHRPSFEERGVYYNVTLNHPAGLTPASWDEQDWSYWLDQLVCAQLTHVYFFLWSDSLYYPKSPKTSGERNRLLSERLQEMIRLAHLRGLKVGYHFVPTHIPSDLFAANKDVLQAKVVYAENGFPIACSAVSERLRYEGHTWNGASDLMSDIYAGQIEQFREADTFQIWFYDPGGCFCGPEQHNCRNLQALRLMEQLDTFVAITRRLNPKSRLIVSLWPIWVLEPMYNVEYHDELLDMLKRYAQAYSEQGDLITVTDSVIGSTYLPAAGERGLRLNAFVYPTNVETGCCIVVPMLETLKVAVDNARQFNAAAIHHMRIEERTKYANTFLASRFYWDADITPEQALRQYVHWIANTNHKSAEELQQALMLLDQFMCRGADKVKHATVGVRIRELIDSAITKLEPEKARELEWLTTTGRAVEIIGQAVNAPERNEELSQKFNQLIAESPSFSSCRVDMTRYVKWVTKGWNEEHF